MSNAPNRNRMKTNSTITIVIPTYNRADKLPRAIRSVLAQTYHDLRLMIFDNASSDGTQTIVMDFMSSDARVFYHCHPENIGLTANFNYAFDCVSTDYFGLLADDDYFVDTFLENAMKAFLEHSSIEFAVFSMLTVDESGNVLFDQLTAWKKEGIYEAGESIVTAVNGNHPVITACIFRKSLAPELHLDSQMDSIADLPIMILLIAKYPFFLSKTVAGYFVRHAGTSGNNFVKLDNYRRVCTAYVRAEKILNEQLPIRLTARQKTLRLFKTRIDKLFFFLLLESLTKEHRDSGRYLEERITERTVSMWQVYGQLLRFLHNTVPPRQLAAVITRSRRILRRIRRTRRGLS
jgi:glycosyltransferase involved in cell wall biosynthesis